MGVPAPTRHNSSFSSYDSIATPDRDASAETNPPSMAVAGAQLHDAKHSPVPVPAAVRYAGT